VRNRLHGLDVSAGRADGRAGDGAGFDGDGDGDVCTDGTACTATGARTGAGAVATTDDIGGGVPSSGAASGCSAACREGADTACVVDAVDAVTGSLRCPISTPPSAAAVTASAPIAPHSTAGDVRFFGPGSPIVEFPSGFEMSDAFMTRSFRRGFAAVP